MQDKQIIIDGIDVSGCYQYMPRYMEDYDIDTLDYCRYHFKPCKDVDVKYCYYKQLKRKEEECEELKKELQAQRDFTRHEQKLIYCAAYDETCKTGNDCKQEKCIFKDNIKLKQALIEIKPALELYANSKIGEEQPDGTYKIIVENSKVLGSICITFDPKPAKQALQKIIECGVEDD